MSMNTGPNCWNVTPAEAVQIQKEIRSQIVLQKAPAPIRFIAGCDLALDVGTETAFAGAIVYRFPELQEVERVSHTQRVTFPYVPGLLSFREAPILLNLLAKLKTEPDVYCFDGHGIAHPRRLGIASHMGLCLNKPTVGFGKSRLCGSYREPGPKAGNVEKLQDSGEQIGWVLRLRDKVNPVFVSPGHLMDLESALSLAIACGDGFRVPKPTREADRYVALVKKEMMGAGKEEKLLRLE